MPARGTGGASSEDSGWQLRGLGVPARRTGAQLGGQGLPAWRTGGASREVLRGHRKRGVGGRPNGRLQKQGDERASSIGELKERTGAPGEGTGRRR